MSNNEIKDITALEIDLTELMKKEALEYAAYMWKDFYDSAKDIYRGLSPHIGDTGLYDYFKFEQWAERERWTKRAECWTKVIVGELVTVSESKLMEQFNKSI